MAETNTILYSNYPSIKKKKKKALSEIQLKWEDVK